MNKRVFVDAKNNERCQSNIIMRDGSGAQCGRKSKSTGFCRQHEKLRGCDCQCPEPASGVKLVSNSCPLHNENPRLP